MSRRRRLPYDASTCFSFAISETECAVGVVARSNGRGTILVYFFAPWRTDVALADLTALTPAHATLVCRAGDLGLLEGKWRILGPLPGWVRDGWPVPVFGQQDVLRSHIWYAIHYDDNTLSEQWRERVPGEAGAQLPEDGLNGYVAAEIGVRQKLGLMPTPPRRT